MGNRLEESNDTTEILKTAFAGLQSKIWTAVPAIVESVKKSEMTVQVQPTIQAIVTNENGQEVNVTLPLLVDVPIIFPSGGGFSLTFPIAQGDECLVLFASRCIDSWWESGKVGPQAEQRLHDLSDGFALFGIKSKPKVVGSFSDDGAQLKSDDGETSVEVSKDGNIKMKAVKVEIDGDLDVTGIVKTADVKFGLFETLLSTHTHQESGGGTTGVPNP